MAGDYISGPWPIGLVECEEVKDEENGIGKDSNASLKKIYVFQR